MIMIEVKLSTWLQSSIYSLEFSRRLSRNVHLEGVFWLVIILALFLSSRNVNVSASSVLIFSICSLYLALLWSLKASAEVDRPRALRNFSQFQLHFWNVLYGKKDFCKQYISEALRFQFQSFVVKRSLSKLKFSKFERINFSFANASTTLSSFMIGSHAWCSAARSNNPK